MEPQLFAATVEVQVGVFVLKVLAIDGEPPVFTVELVTNQVTSLRIGSVVSVATKVMFSPNASVAAEGLMVTVMPEFSVMLNVPVLLVCASEVATTVMTKPGNVVGSGICAGAVYISVVGCTLEKVP